MKPVVKEYNSLSRISEKLTFDPSGRPGASVVRDDQERLKQKQAKYHLRVCAQLGQDVYARTGIMGRTILSPYVYSNGSIRPFSEPSVSKSTVQRWEKNRHAERQAKVDEFLARISLQVTDTDQGSPRELFNLPIGADLGSHGVHALGRGWYYRQLEDESYDRDRYSKSWHRKYGAVREISNRRVVFKRMTKRGPQIKTVSFDGWRGDWLAKAVIEAGLAPSRQSMPSLKIRLNKAYDAKLLYTKRGYTWYARTLVDHVIDYVIVSPLGMIYHDANKSNLIRGLHKKIRSQALKIKGHLIDWAKCKSLGFCDIGLNEFCDIYGFNPKGRYSASEIEEAVRDNPKPAWKFLDELKILANAINYETTWN